MFSYVLERIRSKSMRLDPFMHLYLDEVFSDAHFASIVSTPEVDIKFAQSDGELFGRLASAGYEVINFPGCVTDKDHYIAWRARRSRDDLIHSACEGFGVALRLASPKSGILIELAAFLASEAFRDCLAEKLGVSLVDTRYDYGLQKYLDGYEISPHPDIRQKALTFMVNINPNPGAELLAHHTHYMSFKDDHRFVQDYWRAHPHVDRCWVPWSWCDTKFLQAKNNTMVAFAPADDTIHAVKASYDHLEGQRTQLYGNIWCNTSSARSRLEWQEFAQLRAT